MLSSHCSVGAVFRPSSLFSNAPLSSSFQSATLDNTLIVVLNFDNCYGRMFFHNASGIQPPNSITTLLLPSLLPSNPAVPSAQLRWTRYPSIHILTTCVRTPRRPSLPPFARPRTPGRDVRSCFLSGRLHGGLRGCEVGSASREARCWRGVLRG